MRAVCCLVIFLFGALAYADSGRDIELFVQRADGTRDLVARIDVDALPLRESVGPDPQYDVPMRMRSIALEALWRGAPIPAEADTALLRFDNGLLVPIAFRDVDFMRRLAPRVVRANLAVAPFTHLTAGAIETPRRPPTDEDLRPVTFHGNKVVVADAHLAPMLSAVVADLAPWMYADTLHSIDFVQRIAWEKRLDAGPAARAGETLFLGSCAYCHAVRGVGGNMGWDFVDPYPIYSDAWMQKLGDDDTALAIRSEDRIAPRTLLGLHVRFRSGVSGSRVMPALRGMTAQQVDTLWNWIQMQAAPRR